MIRYLAPGRGLLLVNVGKGSTPLMVAQPYSHQMALPPHATLVTSWAPTAECNATVGGLRFAESFDGDSGLRMNAFTHATYHVDAALTVDPATGRNSTPSLRARFPTNRVVAVLWVRRLCPLCFVVMFVPLLRLTQKLRVALAGAR